MQEQSTHPEVNVQWATNHLEKITTMHAPKAKRSSFSVKQMNTQLVNPPALGCSLHFMLLTPLVSVLN